ncbi:MAG: glycosyltransferase, partial [Thermoplasmata archaeon]|nr:glycosyltransferase [Thermoplasmata archaeon]
MPKSPRQAVRDVRASWERSRGVVVPHRIPPRPPEAGGRRVAFLIYRGNPRCGGQGVYTRHLTRELVALGHSVEVFAGPPWPDLDEGVGFTPVPGLDLYRDPDPFRIPAASEFTSPAHAVEFVTMCLAGFGEPLAYSMRITKLLAPRRAEFDIVHDNQCLGSGILRLHRDGWPLLETLHHPITVDRSIALDHAESAWQRFTTRRWFGFLRMQVRVARRLPHVLTVSSNSRHDISRQMHVPIERMTVVPVGVDHTVFRPYDDVVKRPGRIMVTSSSDVPMKGLVPLLEAVAKLRAERDIDLVVIGRPRPGGRVARNIERLGLGDLVTTVSGVTDEELARLYGQAEVAVVPSLYEGFSLPAIEAMACGVPVVATTGGALPEVVGESGRTGVLVPPDDPSALSQAIGALLDDPAARARLGAAGRERVMQRFTWEVTARGTAECYDAILTGRPLPDATVFAAMHEAGELAPGSVRVAMVQGDGLNLPFPDGSFDRVICSEVL